MSAALRDIKTLSCRQLIHFRHSLSVKNKIRERRVLGGAVSSAEPLIHFAHPSASSTRFLGTQLSPLRRGAAFTLRQRTKDNCNYVTAESSKHTFFLCSANNALFALFATLYTDLSFTQNLIIQFAARLPCNA